LRVSETFWGAFSRNIILPENLDLDEIKAILEKNILIIKIPKLKFKGQSIEIEKIED
jgi:HSP20 family molecular chaperone IbpA